MHSLVRIALVVMAATVFTAGSGWTAPTETGESGLVTMPTTEVLPPRGFSVGAHWNGEAMHNDVADDTDLNKLQVTLGVGLLENLEITSQLPVVFYTRAFARDHRELGQIRVGAKYRLLDEKNGAPISAALLGGVAIGSGQPVFPTVQGRNSLYGRREVWEAMAIIDKVLFTTGRGADAVVTINAGGLFLDQPRAAHFSLQNQTVPFRRRFTGGSRAEFDPAFEWGLGLNLPLTKYATGQVDFLNEWRGNTGTVGPMCGSVPMEYFTGLRWNHQSGLSLRGGADFGLSGQLDAYRYLTSIVYTTPPEAPPPPAAVAQAPPPPPPPPPPIKKKIILRGVNFDFDKSNIRRDAAVILDEAASTLKENAGIKVRIEGHCDAKGTDAYNDELSMRRSEAVLDYLVDHGIAAGRLAADGKGERQPIATNDTDDGRAQNRRVELLVAE